MDFLHTRNRTSIAGRLFVTAAFLLTLFSFTGNGSKAQAADLRPDEYRVSAGEDKFSDTWQFAMAYRIRSPQFLHAQHLELAAGTLSTSVDNKLFVSLGPVWRLPLNNDRMFVDLGISPTLLSGSSFNGRDMGGNFHFTSSAEIVAFIDARNNLSMSLRIQHMSNGGISSTNPGMDMVGIRFAFDFSDR
jgi:hypothetical protein